MIRRLPVYVLLDCSESMAGPGIEALRKAVGSMIVSLRQNPYALETAWVSFISFANKAQVLNPLCPLDDIQEPSITISPGTSLGAALRLVTSSIRADVRKGTKNQKGDFRPIVFIVTDGASTDSCEAAAKALRATKACVYAVGCGSDIDWRQLATVTENIFNLADPSGPGLVSAFKWVSGSISTASSAPLEAGEEATSSYKSSELPDSLERVDMNAVPSYNGHSRQVFLQAWCQQQRLPYLIRFGVTQDQRTYGFVAAHRLNHAFVTEGKEAGGGLPPIDSSLLTGNPVCPYCEAGSCCHCERCRELFCIAMPPPEVICCPCCGLQGRVDRGSFNVNQREG